MNQLFYNLTHKFIFFYIKLFLIFHRKIMCCLAYCLIRKIVTIRSEMLNILNNITFKIIESIKHSTFLLS